MTAGHPDQPNFCSVLYFFSASHVNNLLTYFHIYIYNNHHICVIKYCVADRTSTAGSRDYGLDLRTGCLCFNKPKMVMRQHNITATCGLFPIPTFNQANVKHWNPPRGCAPAWILASRFVAFPPKWSLAGGEIAP